AQRGRALPDRAHRATLQVLAAVRGAAGRAAGARQGAAGGIPGDPPRSALCRGGDTAQYRCQSHERRRGDGGARADRKGAAGASRLSEETICREQGVRGMTMRKKLGAAVLAAAVLVLPQARADDVADFYRGKRINLIVSYGTGGGYDVYARVLARHM